jgi:hypothetical protein
MPTSSKTLYRVVAAPGGCYQITDGTLTYDYTYESVRLALAAVRDFERQDKEEAEWAADGPVPEDELEQLRERVLEILTVMEEWTHAQTDPAELLRCLAELESH